MADIFHVVVSKRAQKEIQLIPVHCQDKLEFWSKSVRKNGLREVKKIKSFHDEPLKGGRQGQRSIRISLSYRAIYVEKFDGTVEFVNIEEVNKHKY